MITASNTFRDRFNQLGDYIAHRRQTISRVGGNVFAILVILMILTIVFMKVFFPNRVVNSVRADAYRTAITQTSPGARSAARASISAYRDCRKAGKTHCIAAARDAARRAGVGESQADLALMRYMQSASSRFGRLAP